MNAANKISRFASGRYPPPGASAIADSIRARRGPRGLTPLDRTLLHVPPVAQGWNSLLGAIRTKGALPGDVRELMILRVAAVNRAAFEWIQHEHVGRSHGLTTAQLYVIRDTSAPLPPAKGILSALQTSALRFADASTRNVKVSKEITDDLHRDLLEWMRENDQGSGDVAEADRLQDLYVEAAAVVATYNMVSRFLVTTDVAGLSDDEVPWPIERKEHFVPIPSETDPSTTSHTIHAVTLIHSPTAPWVVFANSLLTDLTMWSYVIPYLLPDAPSPSSPTSSSPVSLEAQPYNILIHSQRGHGQSTLPALSPSARQATIPHLAYDIAHLIHALSIQTPIHALIGVSQGGATSLAFSSLSSFFPSSSLPSPLPTAKAIVACDTSPRTPGGNKAAWEERASLAYRTRFTFDTYASLASSTSTTANPTAGLDDEYATKLGLSRLASVTIPRWFPTGSSLSSSTPSSPTSASSPSSPTMLHPERAAWVSSLITDTPPRGFVAGAQALAEYDLLSTPTAPSSPDSGVEGGILHPSNNTTGGDATLPKVLLLAGSLDGAGKVGQGLRNLAEKWAGVRGERGEGGVRYVEVESSGHLPMIDEPEKWWSVVGSFLQQV
ncbi:hypothetical protein AX17_004793 [Amanita inopinata Kibby_2008]|nr:hypothetical protein AX17_004793 [Amanita inopinata Kibby_2008]